MVVLEAFRGFEVKEKAGVKWAGHGLDKGDAGKLLSSGTFQKNKD